jgi:hypothetical protein
MNRQLLQRLDISKAKCEVFGEDIFQLSINFFEELPHLRTYKDMEKL